MKNKLLIKNTKYCDLEELKFVFEQSKDFLKSTDEVHSSNLNKSIFLISILVSISSGLFVYFFNNNIYNGVFSPFLFTVLMMGVYLLILSIYLVKAIKNEEWRVIGSEPVKLFNPVFYERKEKDKEYSIIKGMYYTEINNYQNRISENLRDGQKKSMRINNVLKSLVILPFFSVGVYVLSLLINHLL